MHSHPGLNISIGELSIGSRSPALTIFMFVAIWTSSSSSSKAEVGSGGSNAFDRTKRPSGSRLSTSVKA